MKELEEFVEAANGLDEAPPPDVEERMWAAIAAGPVAATVAETATAAATTAASGGSGLVLRLGLAVALVGGGTTVAVVAMQPDAAPQPATTTAAADEPKSARDSVDTPEPELQSVPQAVEPVPVQPESSKPAQRRRPSPTGASLADETKLLRAAKFALSQGNARVARRRLSEHKRRFPKGELTELRMALEVSTLCALGRDRQADTVAKRFLSRFPDSALAPKVRQRCSE